MQSTWLLRDSPSLSGLRKGAGGCVCMWVQVLVDRDGSEQDQEMALLGPGKLLQVSNVVGRGFSSLFNSYVSLMSAMEESRDLLLIGTLLPPSMPHLHQEAYTRLRDLTDGLEGPPIDPRRCCALLKNSTPANAIF